MEQQNSFQWQPIELKFIAQEEYKNPFLGVRLVVVFQHEGGTKMTVPAFWNGDNQWIVRFAPIMPGEWVWQSRCSNKKDSGLHDVTGMIVCMEPDAAATENNPNNKGFLRVNENGRYFEYADGTPFYWLGDTLWLIYTTRCTLEAVLPRYIEDRKQKGFTVIQIVAGRPGGSELEWNGVHDRPHWFSNEAGEPYEERYARINPRYFQLLDAKIELLHRAGLVPCIMGFWGFDIKIGLQAAKQYWGYLLARYGACNVVWSVAGEYFFTSDVKAWRSLGRYIKKNDPYAHPLSLHSTAPHSGSRHYHNEKWYDFNMPQIGHVLSFRQHIEALPLNDYQMKPPKPSIMAESWYENHPNSEGGGPRRIQAEDVRFAAYVSLLQGCIGQTYGAHGIWNLYEQSDHLLWDDFHRPDSWDHDLDLPGSMQMKYLKDAFSQVDWPHLVPMSDNITTPQFTHGYLAGVHGNCYIAYITGKQCDVMLFLPPVRDYEGKWMNPATGQWQQCKHECAPYGSWFRWSAVTPGSGDWVLILKA